MYHNRYPLNKISVIYHLVEILEDLDSCLLEDITINNHQLCNNHLHNILKCPCKLISLVVLLAKANPQWLMIPTSITTLLHLTKLTLCFHLKTKDHLLHYQEEVNFTWMEVSEDLKEEIKKSSETIQWMISKQDLTLSSNCELLRRNIENLSHNFIY